MNWSDSINDKNNYMDTFTSTCILKKENPLQVLSFIEKLSNEMKKDVVLLMVSYIFKEDKEIKKLLDKELSNDVQDLFIDSMKKKDKNIEGYISERVLLNIKLINKMMENEKHKIIYIGEIGYDVSKLLLDKISKKIEKDGFLKSEDLFKEVSSSIKVLGDIELLKKVEALYIKEIGIKIEEIKKQNKKNISQKDEKELEELFLIYRPKNNHEYIQELWNILEIANNKKSHYIRNMALGLLRYCKENMGESVDIQKNIDKVIPLNKLELISIGKKEYQINIFLEMIKHECFLYTYYRDELAERIFLDDEYIKSLKNYTVSGFKDGFSIVNSKLEEILKECIEIKKTTVVDNKIITIELVVKQESLLPTGLSEVDVIKFVEHSLRKGLVEIVKEKIDNVLFELEKEYEEVVIKKIMKEKKVVGKIYKI